MNKHSSKSLMSVLALFEQYPRIIRALAAERSVDILYEYFRSPLSSPC
jgi:hypothetical protein